MSDRNDGTRGEQGAAFILGEAGYFIVDGPSGAGGHAANAHGPDGVAFNPANGDLIIYDVKDFLAKRDFSPGPQLVLRNVSSATAIVENLNADWFNALIASVDATTDMPSRPVISSRLRACRDVLATGRVWPANTRVAVMRMGGGAIGISARLTAMNVTFIDLNTDQVVTAARASRLSLFKEVADTIDRIARQINLNQSEHAQQVRLVTTLDTSSVKGLADTAVGMLGFATNAVFNEQPPAMTIWNKPQNSLSVARRFLRENNIIAAAAAATDARFEMLLAIKKISDWKDKLFGTSTSMGAGTKMMIAIPASAFGVVVVTFGAMLAAPVVIAFFEGLGASAGAVESTASAVTPIARLAATVVAAEHKFRIAETAIEVLEREVEAIEEVTRTLQR